MWMVQWVWLLNYCILYQLSAIVFQILGMLDVFMTTYNFPMSLQFVCISWQKKTPQVNIVDTLQDNVSASVFLPRGFNEVFLASLWSLLCFERALRLALSSSFSQIKKQDMEETHSCSLHASRQDSAPTCSWLAGVRCGLCLHLPLGLAGDFINWLLSKKWSGFILIWFCFSFSVFYLLVCLFSAIWLVQKERAGRKNFLVWIFLYNENLAVELFKHLTEKKPDQLALGWVVPDAGWCLTKLQPK